MLVKVINGGGGPNKFRGFEKNRKFKKGGSALAPESSTSSTSANRGDGSWIMELISIGNSL